MKDAREETRTVAQAQGPSLESRPGGPGYYQTGQCTCHDDSGTRIPCSGSGQDAAFQKGLPWPSPRFILDGPTVRDGLTGLVWTRDANLAEFPVGWGEALEYIRRMNTEGVWGYTDWRLPNRRELRSLISHQTRRPALPEGHPFVNVFPNWYWTSTTAAIAPDHAWYVSMDGGRMFYGGKDQSFMLWPVRGRRRAEQTTGQKVCYSADGHVIPCDGSGQDPEWGPEPATAEGRFQPDGEGLVDARTGLCWRRDADLTRGAVSWSEALRAVGSLSLGRPGATWRLPNINELESLVDCACCRPALPVGQGFAALRDGYWSSTTSLFEPDWAWALYLEKGAVGVGQKSGSHFYVWAVRDPAAP